MSHFDFIDNQTLRNNLDVAFDHLLTLIPLSESANYGKLEKSSFRKTIIIYTASIVEALLCDLVDKKCTEEDRTLYQWEIDNPKELYVINDDNKIVAGKYTYKPTVKKLEKMNLANLNTILRDKGLINPTLFQKVDKIRELRNDQHFGMHSIVKEYTKGDLEFVFSVAKDVKELVRTA